MSSILKTSTYIPPNMLAARSRIRPTWILSAVVGLIMLVTFIDHRSRAAPGNRFGLFHAKKPSTQYSVLDRIAHSEKLWEEAVSYREGMLKENPHDKMRFPYDYYSPYIIWDYVRPAYHCPHDLERVGGLADGGKWICGMTRYEDYSRQNPNDPLIVYSFGVNVDSSFEAALLNRTNAEVWGYDFSVDHWASHITPDMLPRAHFTKAGISKVSNPYKNPPFFSIQDLMRQNNHTYIDILKMDIEGNEFDVMNSFVAFVEALRYSGDGDAAPLLPIGQFLVEIHVMENPPASLNIPAHITEWMSWWEGMERTGFREVYNEENWLGNVGDGRPRYMEYTMINGLDFKRNVLLQ